MVNDAKPKTANDSWIREDDPVRASTTSRHKDAYEDILDERRHSSDIRFVTRSHKNAPSFKYNIPRTPKQLIDHVLKSDRVSHVAEQISKEKKIPLADVAKEAESILNEMAHNFRMRSIRGVAYLLTKVLKSIYKKIYVNVEGIEKLRALIKEYPVVLMPTHRSYTDFLLLSYVCYHYELPVPVIAAAMDFMSMKFVGDVLRGCGAFFIRRTFGSDKLYWAVFTEYVQAQLCNGDAPLEFFVEGTRSRTSKSYVPKRGMLSVALEPYFKAEVSDIMIFPVSISHDRILEEGLYAYELLGIPKPKESTSGLFKARSILSEDYGSVHFFFNDPISIRQYSDGKIDRISHSLSPRHLSKVTKAETDLCQDLAYTLVREHQKHMCISPWALIATILLQNKDGIYLNDLLREVVWLKRSVINLDGYVDWPGCMTPEQVALEQIKTHENLVTMNKDGLLELKRVVASHAKRAARDEILVNGATHLALASYRNQLVHCFVHVGLVAIIVNASTQERLPLDEVYTKYCFLEKLLGRDFIFHPKHRKQDFEHAVKILNNSNVLVLEGDSVVVKKSTNKYNTFLSQMFEPFLLAYWITCQYLMFLPANEMKPPKTMARSVQSLITQLLLQCAVKHYEMLSLDMINNAIHSLVNMDAVIMETRNGVKQVSANYVQLPKIAEQIKSYIENADVTLSSDLLKTTSVSIAAKL
ncbi:dihydroxyacetone phosphate acyltransferase-like [Tubulanus polymorphus]|uniref:dihydroxyacetone phosphate acyltransferase-like n=1 Tax=Tubulanus polymorphus TaxID=672921 RepID=UPI003DA68628